MLEEEQALVSSLNVTLIAYRDHDPKDPLVGGKGYNQLFGIGNNWAALAAASQKLEAGGQGDKKPYDASPAALEEVSKLMWREGSARVLLVVTDGPPHGPAGEGIDPSSDDPFPKGGPDDESIPWPTLAKLLAKRTVASSVALMSLSDDADEFGKSALIAANELAAKSALGFVGKIKRGTGTDEVGKLFAVLVATAEVAMDQRILADTLLEDRFADVLAPLDAPPAGAPAAAVLKVADAAAAKLAAEGFIAREASVHPETDVVQVTRKPLTAVHVWEALKSAVEFKKKEVKEPQQAQVLAETTNDAIMGLYAKLKSGELE